MMQTNRDERACELARWIVENNATVRAAAKRFGISKSTVHKDLSERLRQIDRLLYEKVRLVLEQNKAERHLRGGDATRRKYLHAGTHTAGQAQQQRAQQNQPRKSQRQNASGGQHAKKSLHWIPFFRAEYAKIRPANGEKPQRLYFITACGK